jgi:hypothetical protein
MVLSDCDELECCDDRVKSSASVIHPHAHAYHVFPLLPMSLLGTVKNGWLRPAMHVYKLAGNRMTNIQLRELSSSIPVAQNSASSSLVTPDAGGVDGQQNGPNWDILSESLQRVAQTAAKFKLSTPEERWQKTHENVVPSLPPVADPWAGSVLSRPSIISNRVSYFPRRPHCHGPRRTR